jgi:predicted nucleic acid-binding protein
MLVSNASTLILLAKASVIQEFLDNFRVVIPGEVLGEVSVNKDAFDSMLIRKEVEGGRLEVREIKKSKLTAVLKQFRLHEGEAAAYVLFNEAEAKALLTDDGELIKLCRVERIPFVCAMAVVVRLFEKGLFTKEEAEGKLDRLYDYGRYSKEVYSYFKSRLE